MKMSSNVKSERWSLNRSLQNDEVELTELEHFRKLFIGGLSPATTDETLCNYYGKWGTLIDATVMRDPTTKRSKGFGFITYAKASSVDEAQKNRPHVIDGKAIDSKRALPRPERELKENNLSVKKLFVGGLKDVHNEESLKDYFSQFGNVVSVKILTDKATGRRRGFGYVAFDDYDPVDKAILQRLHTIKHIAVDVKKSVYNKDNQNGVNGNNMNDSMQNNVQPQGPPQAMQPYPQGPPAPYPQPPYNYNYWAPPQYPAPYPPQTGPYPPPPHSGPYPPPQTGPYPPPQSGPYAPNGWCAGPPQPTWYPNQWPQHNAPGAQAPQGNWNAPLASGPPQQVGQTQGNVGGGYQQSYGGGPTKHNQNDSNRMHPYGNANNQNSQSQRTNNQRNGHQNGGSNYRR